MILPLLFASFLNAQTIYKWKDEKGQWHFSQTPPIHEKAEKVNLPNLQEAQIKSRSQWQQFYAEFRDTKYRMAGSTPHTKGLGALTMTSLRFCHVYESLYAISATLGSADKTKEIHENASFCVEEAQAVFPVVLQKAQSELATRKPAALDKLKALGTTWLTLIRRIPRLEHVETLRRMQREEMNQLEQKQSELDMELM